MAKAINNCTRQNREGKIEIGEIAAPLQSGNIYRLPLTDEVLLEHLAPYELQEVCKERGGKAPAYRFSPDVAGILKERVVAKNPEKTPLELPPKAENTFAEVIDQLGRGALHKLRPREIDPSRYLTSAMPFEFGRTEIAIIRYAIGEIAGGESLLRTFADPITGRNDSDSKMRVAFSTDITASGYDNILNYFSALAEYNRERAQLVIEVITSVKAKREDLSLRGSLPAVAVDLAKVPNAQDMLITANMPKNGSLSAERDAISRYETEEPVPYSKDRVIKDGAIHNSNISWQIETPLFKKELAILRWLTGDKGNLFFTNTNPFPVYYEMESGSVSGAQTREVPQIYYISDEVDVPRLIVQVVSMKNIASNYGVDPEQLKRIDLLISDLKRIEGERVNWDKFVAGIVKDQSIGWAFGIAGIPSHFATAALGAGATWAVMAIKNRSVVAVAAKGAAPVVAGRVTAGTIATVVGGTAIAVISAGLSVLFYPSEAY